MAELTRFTVSGTFTAEGIDHAIACLAAHFALMVAEGETMTLGDDPLGPHSLFIAPAVDDPGIGEAEWPSA